jgi:hypothetical protein
MPVREETHMLLLSECVSRREACEKMAVVVVVNELSCVEVEWIWQLKIDEVVIQVIPTFMRDQPQIRRQSDDPRTSFVLLHLDHTHL